MSARRLISTTLASLSALAGLLALATAPAHAAVTHKFLPEPSAKLSEGAPEGCGQATPSPPCIPGSLSTVEALTADSGHVWSAERMNGGKFLGSTRIDKFDSSGGEFLPPQLDEEAGVFESHYGVAVGHPQGEEEVYAGAAQAGRYVVAVFGPSGKLQGTWTGEHALGGSFATIRGVAVDASASLETSGEVYVATAGGPGANVVDVFKPVAGGSEPEEAVGQLRGPETPCVAGEAGCVNPLTHEPCTEGAAGCVILFGEVQGVAVSPANGDVLVANGNEESVVDVFEPASGMPGKYSFLFAITEARQGAFKRIGSIAVDSGTGNIYVAEPRLNVVDEFGPEGKYLGRLTGTPSGPFKGVQSVAVDPVSHHVFVGDHSEETGLGSIDAFDKDLIIPDVETLEATEVTPKSARLNGTINPDGAGEASCQFAWGESEALENTPLKCPSVENGEAAVPVSETLTGLTPDTTYFYRLQSGNKNELNPGEPVQDQHFTTAGPGIHEEWSSEVSSTSATLNAKVDPHGKPTEVFFEYGPTMSYGKSAPSPSAAIGSGEEDVLVKKHVQALTPGSLYHYRAVAVDELGEFHGPDHTFTTQRAGGGFVLPDGRQWEMVSPPDKHGSPLLPIAETGVVQSSVSGAAITYLGFLPLEEHVLGYHERTQALSTRGAGGWSSQNISLPHATAAGLSVGFGPEYRFFSNDLSRGLVEPHGEFTSLKPEVFPPDSEVTPYVRHNSTCAVTPSTCFEPLVTGAPGYENVPPGTKFGETRAGISGAVHFVGGTPDLAHVLLESYLDLTSTSTGGRTELYEWSVGRPPAEQLQLVSLLPPNEEGKELPAAGPRYEGAMAVSADGSRIVWSETLALGRHLYMRVNATQPLGPKGERAPCPPTCTILLDEVQPGVSEARPPNPQFQGASSDGSKVFFTDEQRLTEDSGALDAKPDLYECEVAVVKGELQCRLSDLTPRPASGEPADVRGDVLGASEDGTWIYFVANGVLGEGAKQGAVPGNCRQRGGVVCTLYVWHGGATLPIAVLSSEDENDWATLIDHTARVAPGGGWVAFMSKRSLTGYDNVDANSPPTEPHHDEEVFSYGAQLSAAGKLEPGRLVCASCNPTGTRPVGVEYEKLDGGLVGGDRVWESNTWIAANVPGWTPYQLATALYQSRYLSDEGRLFFNSSDALVPQDINNDEDVYEYEPAGVGDCSASSSTFSERSGGCVALISSGRAAGESGFLDASENGNDVFFLTGERLVPQDIDTLLDVYDAHVCSAAALCFSSSNSPPACTTADACRSAPTPQPQIFGPPASATFFGAGNLAPASTPATRTKSRSAKCRKGHVKKKGRCVKKKPKRKARKSRSGRK